jgi:hypothetical protein
VISARPSTIGSIIRVNRSGSSTTMRPAAPHSRPVRTTFSTPARSARTRSTALVEASCIALVAISRSAGTTTRRYAAATKSSTVSRRMPAADHTSCERMLGRQRAT